MFRCSLLSHDEREKRETVERKKWVGQIYLKIKYNQRISITQAFFGPTNFFFLYTFTPFFLPFSPIKSLSVCIYIVRVPCNYLYTPLQNIPFCLGRVWFLQTNSSSIQVVFHIDPSLFHTYMPITHIINKIKG